MRAMGRVKILNRNGNIVIVMEIENKLIGETEEEFQAVLRADLKW